MPIETQSLAAYGPTVLLTTLVLGVGYAVKPEGGAGAPDRDVPPET